MQIVLISVMQYLVAKKKVLPLEMLAFVLDKNVTLMGWPQRKIYGTKSKPLDSQTKGCNCSQNGRCFGHLFFYQNHFFNKTFFHWNTLCFDLDYIIYTRIYIFFNCG